MVLQPAWPVQASAVPPQPAPAAAAGAPPLPPCGAAGRAAAAGAPRFALASPPRHLRGGDKSCGRESESPFYLHGLKRCRVGRRESRSLAAGCPRVAAAGRRGSAGCCLHGPQRQPTLAAHNSLRLAHPPIVVPLQRTPLTPRLLTVAPAGQVTRPSEVKALLGLRRACTCGCGRTEAASKLWCISEQHRTGRLGKVHLGLAARCWPAPMLPVPRALPTLFLLLAAVLKVAVATVATA